MILDVLRPLETSHQVVLDVAHVQQLGDVLRHCWAPELRQDAAQWLAQQAVEHRETAPGDGADGGQRTGIVLGRAESMVDATSCPSEAGASHTALQCKLSR